MQRTPNTRATSPRQGRYEPRHYRNERANGRQDGVLATELLKGAIAGVVGVWAMDRIGWFMYNREDPAALRQEIRARPDDLDVAHVAANRMAEAAGMSLSPRQPHPAGLAVHYGLGILPGMLYAPLRKSTRGVAAGQGLLYGTALFVVNDELMAPALGLASGPGAYPWQAHARGLVAHLVLGIVTHKTLDLLDRVA
jgi:uncharacterized membrane protein YagU involved in acid resistance